MFKEGDVVTIKDYDKDVMTICGHSIRDSTADFSDIYDFMVTRIYYYIVSDEDKWDYVDQHNELIEVKHIPSGVTWAEAFPRDFILNERLTKKYKRENGINRLLNV